MHYFHNLSSASGSTTRPGFHPDSARDFRPQTPNLPTPGKNPAGAHVLRRSLSQAGRGGRCHKQGAECDTYCTHERVEDADCERRTTSKRLRHVEFCARVIVVVLVEELHIGVIACTHTHTQTDRQRFSNGEAKRRLGDRSLLAGPGAQP